jgi:hypothetical protein
MKQLLLVIAAIITLASCNKASKKPLAKMTIAELKTKKGIDLIGDWDKANSPTSRAKPKAPRPNEATLVTIRYELPINITGTTITGGVSENAYTAGGQKFTDTTIVDGAMGLWECNRVYTAPGPGTGATTTCETQGTGYYRVYSADFVTYDVWASYFKRVE